MEWSIFALLQMFIIAAGVSTACWLRMRGISAQNEALRAHIEKQSDQKVTERTSPEKWLEEKIQQLPEGASTTPVLQIALQHILSAHPQIEDALTSAAQRAGWLPATNENNADTAAHVAELEAELATLREAIEAGGGGERTEELKTLLQQFTRDSREMMACIQTLESENARLREQLRAADNQPADAEPDPQATENAA